MLGVNPQFVAPKPSPNNKNQSPLLVPQGTTGSTGLAIATTSAGYVAVLVGGIQQRVFNGPALVGVANLDCYWTIDGINALPNSNVPAGAILWWSGAMPGTAQYGLVPSDPVDFNYST